MRMRLPFRDFFPNIHRQTLIQKTRENAVDLKVMDKTRLQELCHSRKWPLPNYCTVREGPLHAPRFSATVRVKDHNFATPSYCRSGKEAENTAAAIAYHQLYSFVSHYVNDQGVNPNWDVAADPTLLPIGQMTAQLQEMTLVYGAPVQLTSPPPSAIPMPRLLEVKNDAHPNKHNNGEAVPQIFEESAHRSPANSGSVDFHWKKEMLHNYKNLLQEYAQKKILGRPIYTCEAEGPPHARLFKSKVSLDGKSYEALEFSSTLKEAEQAAAKVACQELSVNQAQEDGHSYKSLLQEFAQKKGLLCPSYETSTYGMSHMAVFVSTVVVAHNTFRGAEAKTKKQAETNAAKVAYCALIDDCRATEPSKVSSGNPSAVVDNVARNMKQIATTEKKKDSEGPSHVNLPYSDPHLTSDGVKIRASDDPTDEQRARNVYSSKRIVILPCKTSLPVPNSLVVLPFSDEQWIAYKT